MPRALRPFLLLVLSLLAPGVGSRTQTPYQATLSRSGEVQLRNTNVQQLFGTLQVGVLDKDLQLLRCQPGREPGAALIRMGDAQVAVTLVAQIESAVVDSRTLKLTCTLTPNRDLNVGGTQVSLSLPARNWLRGKATLGEAEKIIGEEPRQAALLNGSAAPLTLTRQGVTVSLSAGTQPIALVDNRPAGGDDLEMRVGVRTPEGRPWKAGEVETFDLTLTLPGAVRLTREEPLVIRAGDDWLPLDAAVDVVPGSALDFSGLLGDAPAGRWGRVIVRPDGRLGFERSPQPARFWGAALTDGANYLEKGDADRLADRLARLGYNAVRLSRFDAALDDAGNLDRLDYLVAALKKRGIYVAADLYAARKVAGHTPESFKAALRVDPKALDNWKEFARKLLNHVNPHTGAAWKDEPALAILAVVDAPDVVGALRSLSGPVAAAYEGAWAEWRKTRGLMARPLPRTLERDSPAGRELGAFLAETHARAYARMVEFLRRDLGVKALLTDLGGGADVPAYMAARVALDVVDSRFAWDAPDYLDQPGLPPLQGADRGASAVGAGGDGPGRVAMTRLLGKPFLVSAYAYPAPSETRHEGGLLMGAVAALQGWDGVWSAAWARSKDAILAPRPIDDASLAGDPARLAGERAALLLYRRGDLKPAPKTVTRMLSRSALLSAFDEPLSPGFDKLALVTRVGTRIDDPTRPLAPPPDSELRMSAGDSSDALAELIQSGRLTRSNKTNITLETRQSETNEVFLDGSAGTLRIIAPRIQARTMGGVAPRDETLNFGAMTVAVEGADAAVWATALDSKPLTASGRILISHVTDVLNTGTRFLSSERQVLEAWGDLPYLVRRGTATLTLERSRAPQKIQGWRLDTAGNRVAPLEVRVDGVQVTVELATHGPDGKATLYYELVVEDPAPAPTPPKPPAKPR